MSIICPECKKENDDGAEFCKNCGVNLVDVNNESPAPKKRISKTMIITIAVFVIFFAWSFHDFIFLPKYNNLNVFSAALASTFVGLFFSVPTFIIGIIIRKVIGKDNTSSKPK